MSSHIRRRARPLALVTSLAATALLPLTRPAFSQATPKPASPVLPEVDILQQRERPARPRPQAARAPAPASPARPATPAAPPTPAAEPTATLGSYNPALDLDDLALPPGTTLTTAGPVDGYHALSAFSSTKTATPIEQLPQAIQVVPRSVLETQGTRTIAEAVTNVSGVQATNALQTPAYDSARIRGFAAEQWLDGLPVYYNVGDRDALANVERIEVLKGPAAILYGGGAGSPVGGAINVISKLPTDQAGGELGFTFGSHDYLQPTFDINQPVNADGTVLFRVTGEYTAADSFIDFIDTERYAFSPTLTLTDKTATTLTLQGRFSRWEQPEYQGLPAVGTVAGGFAIDRDLFIGPSNIPDSYSDVRGVTATLDHRFNDAVGGSIKARYTRQKFAEFAQTIVGADGFQANEPAVGPSTWGLSNLFLYQEQDEFTVNPNLRVKFDVGPVRSTVLFGGDYTRLTDDGILTADAFTGGAGTVDLADPSFPTPYVRPPDSPFTTFQRPGNLYVTQGLYTQLQSSIHDSVHVLAGVRLASVEIDYLDPASAADFETAKTKVLPRVGAVVDVVPGGSVYASYSEGLRANPYTFFVGPPEPEESQQTEVGFKFNTALGLSGTLALFEIERSKVPVPVGGGFLAAAIGEQRSRGFEADALWQVGANWRVLASFAHVDAELVEAAADAPAGSKLVAVPENSGRLWVTYAFDPGPLGGWSVGAGVYAASGSPIDLANDYTSDGYVTVDAKIGYDTDTYSVAVYAKNLAGEEYFVPYNYFNGRVAAGDDRAFYATLKYKY